MKLRKANLLTIFFSLLAVAGQGPATEKSLSNGGQKDETSVDKNRRRVRIGVGDNGGSSGARSAAARCIAGHLRHKFYGRQDSRF
jgi:hypothetical protein